MRWRLAVDPLLLGAGTALALTGAPLAAAGVGAGLLALHTWATVAPRSSYYLPLHWRLPGETRACALTFDDGPHPEHTPRVLDALAAQGQQATFFVIGAHVAAQAPLLRRIRAEGHALGLHSFSHSRWFNTWSAARVEADLAACAAAIADATSAPPPRLFRPPVGLKNPLVGRAAARLGLVTVNWTTRVWDTWGADTARLEQRFCRAAQPRAIILAHDGHEPGRPASRAATATALALALPRFAVPSRALALDEQQLRLA